MHRSERLAELVATLRCGQTVRLNLDGKTRDWEVATLYKRKCALWDVTRKKRVFVCYGRIFAKQLRFHHFRHWEVLVRWHGEVVKCLGVSEQTNGKVRITDGPSELVGRVIADFFVESRFFLRVGKCNYDKPITAVEYRSGTTALAEAKKLNLTRGVRTDTVPASQIEVSEQPRRRE
jgi:hypothetical protein